MHSKRTIESLKLYLKRKYDFLDDSVIDAILLEIVSQNNSINDEVFMLIKNVRDESIRLNKEVQRKFSKKENQTIAYQLGTVIIDSFKEPNLKKTINSVIALREEYQSRLDKKELSLGEKVPFSLVSFPKIIPKSFKKVNKEIYEYTKNKLAHTSSNPLNGNIDLKDFHDLEKIKHESYPVDKLDSKDSEEIGILKDIVKTDKYIVELLAGYSLLETQIYSFDVKPGKGYFDFKAFNDQKKTVNNAALVSFKLYDSEGNYLLPIDSLPINKNIGSYLYINSGDISEPKFNEIIVELTDPKAAKLELCFYAWKKDVKTFIESDINASFIEDVNAKNKVDRITSFINKLNHNDKVIMLYTTAPYVEHETLELRPNRMAKEYIKLGYKVIFFSFSKVPEDLVMPEKYENNLYQCLFQDVVKVSSLISCKELSEKIFICSSFPDVLALTTMNKLKLSSWKLVYEIRDDMEEFNRVGYSKWYDTKLEVAVIQIAEKVITVSPRLAQKAKVMADIFDIGSSKVKVIQNAAPDALIDKTRFLRTLEVARDRNKSNKVGYIGHLTPAWFDWSLIINSAKSNPDVVYEIIGHGMPGGLNLPDNIIYLGPKTHDEFIEISKHWRVGLIPFTKSPLTYGVDPNKIYEYLAVGLMVVTADMGSVRQCPATYVYERDEDFDRLLNKALNTTYNKNIVSKIKNYVNRSRWSIRADQLLKELSI